MPLTGTQRIVLQTNLARDKAEVLLQGLIEVRDQATEQSCEVLTATGGQPIGRETLDRAIESARRVISQLNRAMEMAELGLSEEAGDALDNTLCELEHLGPLEAPGDYS